MSDLDSPIVNPNYKPTSEPPLPSMPKDLVPLFTDNGDFVPDLWWWSFDTFLVALVEAAAKKMLEYGCGYPCSHAAPGSEGCDCEKEWGEYLEGIRSDLAGYDKFAYAATAEQQEKVQAALHRLVDRLGSWWD